MINKSIKKLVNYGVECGLIEQSDVVYTTNRILEILQLDEYTEPAEGCECDSLEETLREILDFAASKGLIGDDITSRDLFDTKVMSALVPRPSEVIDTFYSLYDELSPESATDYYYKLSCDSNYIRRQRIKKDQKWTIFYLNSWLCACAHLPLERGGWRPLTLHKLNSWL